ncbi:MAG TPA: exodeoxyribonuclease VII small subunit [Pseudobdellovibrionaceae bacterium]|nr:exodeoxyribonuclease VII small subunit [Pseudobdellovibrionaceae bacterium]
MDFEKKLSRLEEIVEKMESGEMPLEESLRLFEEGVKLSRECNVQLADAEQKVKLLLSVDEQGGAITEDFDPEAED